MNSRKQVEHIGSLLRASVAQAPDAVAFAAPDLTLTRSQFLTVCERYARRMQTVGIRKGELVSVNTMDAFASIVCCFALSFIGARYIPFGTDLLEDGAPKVTHFLRDISQEPNTRLQEIVVDGSWFEPVEGDEFTGFDDPSDVCWISPSSGTTGRAKFIEISVALLNARVRAVAADYKPDATRVMILFHGGSRPFIIRAVAALTHGCVLVDHATPEFATSQGVNFICASPNQIGTWLGQRRLTPKLPIIQVSGAKLPTGQISDLLESFECVEDVYGSNETIKCLARCWTGTPGHIRSDSILFGEAEVQVVDDTDGPLPTGEDGRVRIKTDWMVQGYLGDHKTSQQHFRDGWFYPGDIGRLGPEGNLDILRREGEAINIGGQKVILSDIERTMTATANVRRVGCFVIEGHGDEADLLAACLVLEQPSSKEKTVMDAWRTCAERHGRDLTPSALLVMADLPMTDDGVVKRGLAKAAFLQTINTASRHELQDNLFRFRRTSDDR